MTNLTDKILKNKSIREADDKAKKAIKSLIDTDWAKDNEAQMKAVQLLKGIALSDAPEANAFMKKLDKATSNIKIDNISSKDENNDISSDK